MEYFEKIENVGFVKGLQKAGLLFDKSKTEVLAELEEHFKKFSEMDEHTLKIYKMGCKYAIELIQYNFNTKNGKEQIKTITEWDTEKQEPVK